MKLKNKMAILAATGAVGLISANSALAFENEFHGSYMLKYFISNYEDKTSNPFLHYNDANRNGSRHRKLSNFFETRARFNYTAKASDSLKLVTSFEIDADFGDSIQGNGRNSGAGLESDQVNLETRWVYLDFKIPSTPIKVTAGIQPVRDKFKGVFFDADVAGINTVSAFGPATVGLGYYRAYDRNWFGTGTSGNYRYPKGSNNLDIVALSGDYNINKDLKVGAAYYLYSDSRLADSHATLHVFGVNADVKINELTLSGFAAVQQGAQDRPGLSDRKFNGYAFNLGKHPVGPGTLRTAFLYTSGDDGKGANSAWQGVNQSDGLGSSSLNGESRMVNSYNESGLILLNRNTAKGGTTADGHLVTSTGNLNQGMTLATLGYDATITPKWYATGNIGVGWTSKDNPNTRADGRRSGSNFLGTEVNVETGYKMYDNLTALVQGAYVFLGGYYSHVDQELGPSGKKPQNPFSVRVALNYSF